MSNFHFPEDLLPELLSWLPVKTLMRFRLVSKSWRDLTESKSFGKLHSNRLAHSNYSPDIVVCSHHYGGLGFISRLNAANCATKSIKELRFPPPLECSCTGIQLLGSCNGVLCLGYTDPRIVLWNPLSLNYWERLRPRPSRPSRHYKFCNYGFGYDRTTDDYKVVALAELVDGNDASVPFEGHIYSLNLKRWKRIGDFAYHLRGPIYNDIVESGVGVLVSGALHWITLDHLILSFDLANEKFDMVPPPNNVCIDYLVLGSVGNCLSLTSDGIFDYFEMWVMKDYGVKESWTMIHVNLTLSIPRCIGCLSNNEVIFTEEYDKVVLYDIERQSGAVILHGWQSAHAVLLHVHLQAYGYRETLECFGGTTLGRQERVSSA